MAFFGGILTASPATGGPGDVIQVTFPPRAPGILDPMSGIPMRVGLVVANPAVPGSTVIGGILFTAQWTAVNADLIQVVVPPVGTANPTTQIAPGSYVIDVAQGFDRAHTGNNVQVTLASTAGVPATPALVLTPTPSPAPSPSFPIGSILNPGGFPNPGAGAPGITVSIPVTIPFSSMLNPSGWPLGALSPAAATPFPFPHPWGGRLTFLQRITTGVPWPRGLVFVGATTTEPATLVALSRGCPRGEGGPDPANDKAGTLFKVDHNPPVVEFAGQAALHNAIKNNATVLASPSTPPFRLLNATTTPFTDDIETDRPYAGLDKDEVGNFYVGCFSGIDIPKLVTGGVEVHGPLFRKNATDAVHRYDLRDSAWHKVVDQPTPAPIQGVRDQVPVGPNWNSVSMSNQYYPAGWLNGPDGLCVKGQFLYVVAKDNHSLVKYDLGQILAGPGDNIPTAELLYQGSNAANDFFDSPSEVAVFAHGNDDYIYVSFRATRKNNIYRWKLDNDGKLEGNPQHVAQFPDGSQLIDLAFDSADDLYVSAASGKVLPNRNKTGAIWKFRPGTGVFTGTDGNIHMVLPAKCSNIAVDDLDQLYVCCNNDESGAAQPWGGVIYRVITVI